MNTDMEKLFVAECAVEWLLRLETAGPEERAEFWTWLTESPLHVQELLLAKASDTVLYHLLREGGIDTSALLSRATNVHEINSHQGDVQVPDPSRSAARPRALRRPFRKIAAVVVFLAFVTLMALGIQVVSNDTVTTASGEWRTRQLADGTLLQAGPRTRVSIEFTDDRRLVRFARGEVLFHVAKDPKRPFLVDTGLATARVVGTVFAVSGVDRNGIVVTVQEGVVAVARRAHPRISGTIIDSADGASITLRAGEQVRVKEALPLRAQHVHVRSELAWAEGRFVFLTETVEQAAHKFNLRNKVQIRIVDEAVAQRAVRGVFKAADPQTFAAFLAEQGLVVIVHDEPDTLLLVPATDAQNVAAGD